MIMLENIQPFHANGVICCRPLSAHIGAGEHVRVEGANGSGKSTLLRVLSGLHRRYHGFYRLDRENGADLSAGDIRRRGCVYLSQASFLFNDLRLSEFRRLTDAVVPLDRQPLLEEATAGISRNQLLRHLSGGQRQFVAVLAILALKASIYMLDEPFRHLDKSRRQRLKELFMDCFNAPGRSLILVDHQRVLDDALPFKHVVRVEKEINKC